VVESRGRTRPAAGCGARCPLAGAGPGTRSEFRHAAKGGWPDHARRLDPGGISKLPFVTRRAGRRSGAASAERSAGESGDSRSYEALVSQGTVRGLRPRSSMSASEPRRRSRSTWSRRLSRFHIRKRSRRHFGSVSRLDKKVHRTSFSRIALDSAHPGFK
jgi:hypothetical protein